MSATIRPLTEADLPQARRMCHAAFGTFLGAPDPDNFWTDRDCVMAGSAQSMSRASALSRRAS